MGLDMYLNGEIYFYGLTEEQLKTQPIEQIFRLGYWRKHPDLHGFIVKKFADGEDNCQPIGLGTCEMLEIINAIREDRLPHTTGFFFGESTNDEAEKAEAIAIFQAAIEWLAAEEKGTGRDVVYRASW